jgi:hypothetical protein
MKPPADMDPQGRRAFVISNDPSHKQCIRADESLISAIYPPDVRGAVSPAICFGDFINLALLSGLSAEVRTVVSSDSSTLTASKAALESRLCFDGALANKAREQFLNTPPPPWQIDPESLVRFLQAVRNADYHPVCGGTGPIDVWSAPLGRSSEAMASASQVELSRNSNDSPGINTLAISPRSLTGQLIWDVNFGQRNKITVGLRSMVSIYNFLGRLLNNQGNTLNFFTGPIAPGDDARLLTVQRKKSPFNLDQQSECFTYASYYDSSYCVPTGGAENTKRIFSLLSELATQ